MPAQIPYRISGGMSVAHHRSLLLLSRDGADEIAHSGRSPAVIGFESESAEEVIHGAISSARVRLLKKMVQQQPTSSRCSAARGYGRSRLQRFEQRPEERSPDAPVPPRGPRWKRYPTSSARFRSAVRTIVLSAKEPVYPLGGPRVPLRRNRRVERAVVREAPSFPNGDGTSCPRWRPGTQTLRVERSSGRPRSGRDGTAEDRPAVEGTMRA